MSAMVAPAAALALGPSTVLDAPGPARALVAFGIVLALGGLLAWRLQPLLDRSRASSMDRPLSSLAYGIAAHGVIAFAGIYLATRLSQFWIDGWNVGLVGVLVGILLVLMAAGVGFTVVGSTVVELGWGRHRWRGAGAGALLAGVAGYLDPLFGGFLWFVVVSFGIGGLARSWLHADVVDGI